MPQSTCIWVCLSSLFMCTPIWVPKRSLGRKVGKVYNRSSPHALHRSLALSPPKYLCCIPGSKTNLRKVKEVPTSLSHLPGLMTSAMWWIRPLSLYESQKDSQRAARSTSQSMLKGVFSLVLWGSALSSATCYQSWATKFQQSIELGTTHFAKLCLTLSQDLDTRPTWVRPLLTSTS